MAGPATRYYLWVPDVGRWVMCDGCSGTEPVRGEYEVMPIRQTEYTEVLLVDDSAQDPANATHLYRVYRSEMNAAGHSDGGLLAEINFQRGPINERGVNGIQNEDLLAIVIDRLVHFQDGPFACDENDIAIQAIELGLQVLNMRTRKRKVRGVDGELTA